MSKQTAVEWLLEEWPILESQIPPRIIDQAKAMEREQIIEAFDEGKSDGYKTAREWDEMVIFSNSEQYYNQTYGGEE